MGRAAADDDGRQTDAQMSGSAVAKCWVVTDASAIRSNQAAQQRESVRERDICERIILADLAPLDTTSPHCVDPA